MTRCDFCPTKLDEYNENYINSHTIICNTCFNEEFQYCDNCNNIVSKKLVKQQYNSFNPTKYDVLWDLCPKCYDYWMELAK